MRKLNFVFGGKETAVNEPTYRKAKVWREKVEARLKELGAIVNSDELPDLIKRAAALDLPENVKELKDARLDETAAIIQQIAPAIGGLFTTILGIVDEAADLVIAYCPEVEEELNERAYNDEIIAAVWECIKSAFPFGMIRTIALTALQDGRKQTQTITNSSYPNGAKTAAKTKKKS